MGEFNGGSVGSLKELNCWRALAPALANTQPHQGRALPSRPSILLPPYQSAHGLYTEPPVHQYAAKTHTLSINALGPWPRRAARIHTQANMAFPRT